MNLGAYRLKNPLPEMHPQAAPGAAPGSAFTSTPGVLDAVPQLYPGGPTDLGFLYQQLQKVPFLGTTQTFTVPQTFQATAPAATSGVINLLLSDTGGGSDSDLLRPPHLILEHDTVATTVSGVGVAIYLQAKDTAGAVVRIGKAVAEITTPTAGVVDSTQAWCVMKGGTEVEVFRIKGGGTGMAATAGSSIANNVIGGQLWVRGDLLASGDAQYQKLDAVTNLPLRLQTFEHLLSAGTVAAGFGMEHYWQSRDASNNLVGIGRQQVVIATPTAGAVDSAIAWTVSRSGVEVEVARVRGAGMAPTSGSSFVNNMIGGQFFIRGDLLHAGTSLGFYNATPAVKPTVSGSRGSNAALASLLSALATLGLVTDSSS